LRAVTELLWKLWMGNEECKLDETFYMHLLNIGFRFYDDTLDAYDDTLDARLKRKQVGEDPNE